MSNGEPQPPGDLYGGIWAPLARWAMAGPATGPAVDVQPAYGRYRRGKPARFASFDTRPCEVPPEWRGTYRAPWTNQKEEEQRAAAAD